jgi:threonine/homoserine/homoserine lactone efflux protein
MPDWSALTLFVTTALILVFIPGPNTLFIVARSIEQGGAAGIVSSLGVQTGTLFHVAAAAFGLSALILSSATAFNAVKYAGAIYLIYLGAKTLLTKETSEQSQTLEKTSLKRIFLQGAVINLLNPKTALFFFAFLPQFVDASRGAITAQIIFLSFILVLLGTFSDLVYALAAGSIGNRLRENLKLLRAQKYFAGTVYIALGALTALSGAAHKSDLR